MSYLLAVLGGSSRFPPPPLLAEMPEAPLLYVMQYLFWFGSVAVGKGLRYM